MDFVRRWSEKTEISAGQFIRWLDDLAVPLAPALELAGRDVRWHDSFCRCTALRYFMKVDC